MSGDQLESQKMFQQTTHEPLIGDSSPAMTYCNNALNIHPDIAEQQRAEDAQRLLAAIVSSSDDAIISKNLDGIINSWNHAAESLFGHRAEEAIGQHITLIIPPELWKEEEEIIAKLRKGIRIDHYETIRVTKDGRKVEVSLSISPVRDQQGKIIGAAKVARDITRQKAMDRKLQEAEEQTRHARDQLGIILQGVTDGIIVYDKDDHIIYANEAAGQMTGYESIQGLQQERPPEDIIRHTLTDEQGQPFPIAHLPHRRVLAGEREAQATIGYSQKVDGPPQHWSLVKASPIYDEKGDVLFVITIIHDITERVLAEQRKDMFISMASHELKTPVTSLKGFVYVLRRRLDQQKDERGLYYLSRMDTQLDKLTKLVSDLLDISRIQMGKLGFRRAIFDLDMLISETVENVQAATSTHQIQIVGKTEAHISGDKDRFEQVLINLLTNAIKYSSKANQVIVHLSRDQTHAIVRVQDFGIGIDEVHQQKIFERFYQITTSDGLTYPGLGIGLHISKEIIEQHQGRIEVLSRQNEGATFSVFLPVPQEEALN